MNPLTLLIQQVDKIAHNNELIMQIINNLESQNFPINFESMDYACDQDAFPSKKANHEDMLARLKSLKNLDEETREKLKKKRLAQYIVEKKLLDEPPSAKPSEGISSNEPEIDLVKNLSKVVIPVSLMELMEMPSMHQKVHDFLKRQSSI